MPVPVKVRASHGLPWRTPPRRRARAWRSPRCPRRPWWRAPSGRTRVHRPPPRARRPNHGYHIRRAGTCLPGAHLAPGPKDAGETCFVRRNPLVSGNGFARVRHHRIFHGLKLAKKGRCGNAGRRFSTRCHEIRGQRLPCRFSMRHPPRCFSQPSQCKRICDRHRKPSGRASRAERPSSQTARSR